MSIISILAVYLQDTKNNCNHYDKLNKKPIFYLRRCYGERTYGLRMPRHMETGGNLKISHHFCNNID